MGLFDKLFKGKLTEAEKESSLKEPHTAPTNKSFPYCLMRVLSMTTLAHYHDSEELSTSVSMEKSDWKIILSTLLKVIGTDPVVIYYGEMPYNRAEGTALLLKTFLEEKSVSVLGTYKCNKLVQAYASSMSDRFLKELATEVIDGEFVVFITQEANMAAYMKKEHPDKQYYPTKPGDTIKSDGTYL